MENKIEKFKEFFEDAMAKADRSKGRIQFEVPFEDLKELTSFLGSVMHMEERCVAPADKSLDVRVCKLADTVASMTSSDYKERFKAEYYQTKIRYEKLKALNTKIEAAHATSHRKDGVEFPLFECPTDMLRDQQRFMGEYLHILEVRAVIEGIDL